MIIAKKVDGNGHIDILTLVNKYPKLCKEETNVFVFINKIFNQELKSVNTPKISAAVPIITETIGYTSNYKLNLSVPLLKYGIPKDYFIEIIASYFIINNHDGGEITIPIFPNEIVLDCEYGIKKHVEEERELLQKVAEGYEIIGKLYHIGLTEMAEDLREGIIRLEKMDIDGSIKFFRKAIEGFEKWVSDETLKSPNRVDAIKKYLKNLHDSVTHTQSMRNANCLNQP
ncbi:hypothetical protein [Methanothrix sp.]|uniref:hypothetical protein n=1 Tax=Methanothrix sp. TaxID=90426 RepID=UPI003BB55F17